MLQQPENTEAFDRTERTIMIEFRNVRYTPDGKRDTISGFNLKVESGETLVLLGRSGCGKTTTLKLVNRLIEATEGEVLVQGRPVREWDPIRLRRRIGYVIQEVGLLPHFTVEHNIALLPRLEGWPPERRRQRVEELMEMVALDPAKFGCRYPRELSGGQRQRVGVVRALAADPPILLMDEPFGALDPLTRAGIQREFLALQKRLQKTILFVTHDVREALILGTRIALIENGRLAGTYSRADFMNTDEPAVAAYREVLRIGD
jgi:osmoprotectant transport system ATP-binding protein